LATQPPSPTIVKPTFRELIRYFLGFGYLIWWFAKTRIARVTSWATSRILFAGFAVIFFDVVAHTSTQTILEAIRQNPWLARTIVVFQAAWLLAILAAANNEISSWRKRKQEVFFVDAVDLLLDKLDKLAEDGDPTAQRTELESFIAESLEVMRSTFKEKRTVQTNFARLIAGKLCIMKVDPPDADYDPNFAPALGEGGSGYAASKKAIVYFPSIWIRHAIHIGFDRTRRPTKFASPGVMLRLYLPVAKKYEIYKSILTVPVIWEDPTPYGVLNFDSKKRDAFSELDFKIASIYGQLLGLAFKRLPSA